MISQFFKEVNEENKPFLKKVRQSLKERVETVNVSQRLVDSPACVVTGEHDLKGVPDRWRLYRVSKDE